MHKQAFNHGHGMGQLETDAETHLIRDGISIISAIACSGKECAKRNQCYRYRKKYYSNSCVTFFASPSKEQKIKCDFFVEIPDEYPEPDKNRWMHKKDHEWEGYKFKYIDTGLGTKAPVVIND